MRAANGTSIRLCMEPPVLRILMLMIARGTHRKILHRSVGTVVRKGFDDREPGAAVGAIGERIEVSSIRDVEHLPETIGTCRDIGHDKSCLWPGLIAHFDFKSDESRTIEE